VSTDELLSREVAGAASVPHGCPPCDQPDVVTIGNDRWSLDVLPGTGASLGAGRIRTPDGVWRDLLRPTPQTATGNPERCASFLMLPWSNRIDQGRLTFGGQTWQLQRTGADGTAIHGATRHAQWTITSHDPDQVTLELVSSEQVGINFPWQFRAAVTYRLDGSVLRVTTVLRNTDVEPFPAGFGHHPYFRRALLPVGSAGDPQAQPMLEIPAGSGYPLARGIATGSAAAIPARADYRVARPVGSAFVDDVLTGFVVEASGNATEARDASGADTGALATFDAEGCTAARITYPAVDHPDVVVDLRTDDAYGHLVVYVPRRRGYFAVEPVTHVNGGLALHQAGVEGTGVVILEPGQDQRATFTISVTTS